MQAPPSSPLLPNSPLPTDTQEILEQPPRHVKRPPLRPHTTGDAPPLLLTHRGSSFIHTVAGDVACISTAVRIGSSPTRHKRIERCVRRNGTWTPSEQHARESIPPAHKPPTLTNLSRRPRSGAAHMRGGYLHSVRHRASTTASPGGGRPTESRVPALQRTVRCVVTVGRPPRVTRGALYTPHSATTPP